MLMQGVTFTCKHRVLDHNVRHPRCVYYKLDWSLYTGLTQLYAGIDMYNLLHKEQLHVSALFIGHLQVDKWETLVSSYTWFVWVVYSGEVKGGYCIQPTQVECSCLPMFLIYQPEDGQWKGPKHVVVLYVINYTYLYHHIVVSDRYTNSNLGTNISSIITVAFLLQWKSCISSYAPTRMRQITVRFKGHNRSLSTQLA